MRTLAIFAMAAVMGCTTASSAQVLSKSSKANPSTQGYGTTGAILKDQRTTTKKDQSAANQSAPGNSPAETAGAATPTNTSRPEVEKRSGK